MIRLLRHICVSQASLSNAHHWLKRRDLDRTLSFQSPDFVHCTRRCTHCLHHQKLHWQLVLANWLLVLDEEVARDQSVESLKRFQAHFEVLHRPHLNPWTCASLPSAVYLAAILHQFSFPSVLVDPVSMSLLVLVVTLNGRSRDFVDPQLLHHHLRPELPESGSAELRKEVQQVVAAGWYARMNVEVLAHVI